MLIYKQSTWPKILRTQWSKQAKNEYADKTCTVKHGVANLYERNVQRSVAKAALRCDVVASYK